MPAISPCAAASSYPELPHSCQAANGAHHRDLYIFGQRRRKPLQVKLAAVFAARLQKELVAVFVSKPHHLVFNGRAVTRPDAVDDAGEKRRTVKRTADNIVRLFVGVGHVAAHGVARADIGIKRKSLRVRISVLRLED